MRFQIVRFMTLLLQLLLRFSLLLFFTSSLSDADARVPEVLVADCDTVAFVMFLFFFFFCFRFRSCSCRISVSRCFFSTFSWCQFLDSEIQVSDPPGPELS